MVEAAIVRDYLVGPQSGRGRSRLGVLPWTDPPWFLLSISGGTALVIKRLS
jgi:hypothetical protein